MEFMNLICLLVSLGMLFWLYIFDVKNSVTQFITFVIMLISNFGYFFLAISSNVEEAILAQKIAYVGGIFLPVFYFFLVLEICHVKLNRFAGSVLLLIQCVIFGIVCTIGRSGLYYKFTSIHTIDGVTYIDREYGPLHFLCPLTLVIYLLLSFAVAIYSLAKKKSVHRSGVLAMLIFASIAVCTYVVEKAMQLEYEIIPISFVVLTFGTLIPVYDSNIFTVYENTDIIKEQLNKIGFLTFDKKRAYRGCNDFMANIYPELLDYRLGQTIADCSESLQSVIEQIEELERFYNDNFRRRHTQIQLKTFVLNGKCYAGTIHVVTNIFGVLKGYTIELRDDTEHYLALELKERYNEQLTNEVDAKTKRIRFIQQKTIMGIAQMVESRDLSTGDHIKRTSDVVRIFVKKLMDEDFGFEERFLELVIRSAPMHDLGKIGVDDAVLRKQGRFTDEEYSIMKKHSEIGYHMVSEILSDVEEEDFVCVAENVAHYHHEKIDGTGYPIGLKGEEIPIEARIMALADVFDALVSKRCYKEAFSYDKAFEIIENEAGTHFDAQLAGVFLRCRPQLEEYYNKCDK